MRVVRPRVALLLVLAVALVAAVTGQALGERSQLGDLIVSLDGQLEPLQLPRDRSVPVSVEIEGGLQSADGSLLPPVAAVEVGLPGRGELSTSGLPLCPTRKLRHATAAAALAACGDAKVGEGKLSAQVAVPNQPPFEIRAKVLAFNGRSHGKRAVVLDAISSEPPLSIIVPFTIESRSGRLGTVLHADLPATALGAPPHAVTVSMTLGRRFSFRGQKRSYLSASCPLPRRLTAGFFSFAEIHFILEDGTRIGTSIARSCRAPRSHG